MIQARQDFIDQRDDFYMVGVSFVCSDSVIDKLCAEAKYIKVIDDKIHRQNFLVSGLISRSLFFKLFVIIVH